MTKEVMDYEVWFSLRKEVLRTLDNLAYWQGRVDSGIKVPSEFYSYVNTWLTQLSTLMRIAKTGYCVETGVEPRGTSYAEVYRWLRIDYENSYTVLYESCKKRFFE